MKSFGEKEFIKLNRKIVDWKWYSNPVVRSLFIHCLIMANWTGGTWQNITYERGQFITSLPSLSEELGFTIQKIRTALTHLKSTGEITDQTTNKYRVITVVNYEKYQGDNRQNNSPLTDNQQTTNRQLTADKEIKNNKEYKEVKKKDIALEGEKTPKPERLKTKLDLMREEENAPPVDYGWEDD